MCRIFFFFKTQDCFNIQIKGLEHMEQVYRVEYKTKPRPVAAVEQDGEGKGNVEG